MSFSTPIAIATVERARRDRVAGPAQRFGPGRAHVLDAGYGLVLNFEGLGEREPRDARARDAEPAGVDVFGVDSGRRVGLVRRIDQEIIRPLFQCSPNRVHLIFTIATRSLIPLLGINVPPSVRPWGAPSRNNCESVGGRQPAEGHLDFRSRTSQVRNRSSHTGNARRPRQARLLVQYICDTLEFTGLSQGERHRGAASVAKSCRAP